MIYPPSEDSYLLSEEVEKYVSKLKYTPIKVLDMGSGSGIQAKTAIKAGAKKENVLAVDINEEAIKELKKQKLNTIKSNLFSNIKGKFGLIIFNAPYLPEDKYDKQCDTTAGKKGYEIILKFLRQAKSHLKENGAILLLFSNLSKPKMILSEAKKQKYKSEKLSEQDMGFFEKLFVYKISRQ